MRVLAAAAPVGAWAGFGAGRGGGRAGRARVGGGEEGACAPRSFVSRFLGGPAPLAPRLFPAMTSPRSCEPSGRWVGERLAGTRHAALGGGARVAGGNATWSWGRGTRPWGRGNSGWLECRSALGAGQGPGARATTGGGSAARPWGRGNPWRRERGTRALGALSVATRGLRGGIRGRGPSVGLVVCGHCGPGPFPSVW